eukprot:12938393-Prorocentrum_lima.AAC.1
MLASGGVVGDHFDAGGLPGVQQNGKFTPHTSPMMMMEDGLATYPEEDEEPLPGGQEYSVEGQLYHH